MTRGERMFGWIARGLIFAAAILLSLDGLGVFR